MKGAADNIEATIKDAAGKATGNEKTQAEGKFDKAKGAARECVMTLSRTEASASPTSSSLVYLRELTRVPGIERRGKRSSGNLLGRRHVP